MRSSVVLCPKAIVIEPKTFFITRHYLTVAVYHADYIYIARENIVRNPEWFSRSGLRISETDLTISQKLRLSH